MWQQIITKGNRAVVITFNGKGTGRFIATLWVNARHGLADADITDRRWSGKTEKGARRWAERMLAD